MKKQNRKTKFSLKRVKNIFRARTLKVLVVLFAIAFTAQSCGLLGSRGGGAEPIELVWWKVFDDQRTVQPLIEEFQKQYSNVRVRYVEKNIETYEDELVDALASGRGPDIFSIHNDWLPKHLEKIAPFPENVLGQREFEDSFVEVAAFDLVNDDQVYAVPLSVDVMSLFYNKDILASAGIARPPSTWEELVSIAPRLTRRDSLGNFTRSAVAMGTSENVNRAVDIVGLLMLQNGTPFYSQDRSRSTLGQTVRDPGGQGSRPGAQALEFYTQFANPAKTTYTWNALSNNSIEAFSSGQAAMIFSYSYLLPVLADRAPFLNYDIAPAPQIDENQTRINIANYWAEAVAKQSSNQEAAHAFLKYISSAQVLPRYYEAVKQPSSRIDIIEQQLNDPDIGVFAENALSARSFYKPDSNAVDSIFIQMIEDVILRDVTPESAVSAAEQKINLLLRNF